MGRNEGVRSHILLIKFFHCTVLEKMLDLMVVLFFLVATKVEFLENCIAKKHEVQFFEKLLPPLQP